METTFFSNTSKQIFKDGNAIVLGISPFNSYFSESTIESLYRWSLKHFKNIWIFVPDAPTKFTLMALGYEESKAIKKARRQCNTLFNKIERIANLELSNVTLVNSEWLSTSKVYQEKLSFIYQLFDRNKAFREECLECSRLMINNHSDQISEPNLLIAVNYLLSELPLFTASSDIFQEKNTVFCYHNNPPFIQRLFQEQLFDLVNHKQGLMSAYL